MSIDLTTDFKYFLLVFTLCLQTSYLLCWTVLEPSDGVSFYINYGATGDLNFELLSEKCILLSELTNITRGTTRLKKDCKTSLFDVNRQIHKTFLKTLKFSTGVSDGHSLIISTIISPYATDFLICVFGRGSPVS